MNMKMRYEFLFVGNVDPRLIEPAHKGSDHNKHTAETEEIQANSTEVPTTWSYWQKMIP